MQNKATEQQAAERLFRAKGKTALNGLAGRAIGACIKNGVMQADYANYARAFVEKLDSGGSFTGEFWGKWLTSAALAYAYEPKPAYRRTLDDAVSRLLAAQEAGGRLSASREDFTTWDLWGRKYALLGLVAYYDIAGDGRALDCACRMLEDIIRATMDAGVKVTETGLSLLQGLPSCSILQPVVLLYERSGNRRFLDFAVHIVELWEQPSAYSPNGLRLLSDPLAGKSPVEIASPKGYETMSCFEGLCELYRVTRERRYLEPVLAYMGKVAEREIMIVGSGSSGELWCEGAFRQGNTLETPMETCVTATYMKICHQLLRLTGDGIWADRLEVSLYNALLGAMEPDGSWWAYFSPLSGQRAPSHIQLEEMRSSCCVLNGPRALMEVPLWAAMEAADGVALNLYEAGAYEASCGGGRIAWEQNTGYPSAGRVSIRLLDAPGGAFALYARIPGWAGPAAARLNGETVACAPERGYLRIHREWSPGDELCLDFDVSPRMVACPGNIACKALMAGPLALGLDARFVDGEAELLWLYGEGAAPIHDAPTGIAYYRPKPLDAGAVRPHARKIALEGVNAAYSVRFVKRPVHFFQHGAKELVFVDYASCGGGLNAGHPFRVWFGEPMLASEIFSTGVRAIISGEGIKMPDA